MTATLKLHTRSPEVAEEVLLPLQGQSVALDGLDSASTSVTLRFETVAVQRGAFETTFEMLAKVDWGGLATSVATGIVSNWIYAMIARRSAAKAKGRETQADKPMPIQVVLVHKSRNVEINISTPETIRQSVAAGLADPEPKPKRSP